MIPLTLAEVADAVGGRLIGGAAAMTPPDGAARRRWAVLGEMLELAEDGAAQHAGLAAQLLVDPLVDSFGGAS